MSLNINDLIHTISIYIWPTVRLSGFVISLPIISSAVTPKKVRLIFMLYLALIVAPSHPEWPSLLSFSAISVVGLAQEFFIGVLMGFIIQFVFQAFILGGQVIAMQAGLGFATLVDPASKASVPLVSQFYLMLVTLIFLTLDGHLLMIEMVVKSFDIQPLGTTTVGVKTLWTFIMFSGWIFKAAIFLALPAIVSLLVVSLSFGIMMKAAPQINIFSVGFPITLILGIVIVYISSQNILPHIQNILNEAFTTVQEMISHV